MPTPTIVEVKELPGKTGSATISPGSVTADEVRKFSVRYDSPGASATEAKNAEGVPPYMSTLGDTALRVMNKQATQVEDRPDLFVVTVNYSLPQPGQNEKKTEESTKWNIKISGSAVPREIDPRTDWSGKKIATSAGEPFTGQTKTLYDEHIVVSYDTYEPVWDDIVKWCGFVHIAETTLAVNGVDRVFPLGSLLYNSYEWSETRDIEGASATSITLHLLFRNSMFAISGDENWYPWRLVYDDVGSYYKVSGGVTPFPDANNNPLKYGNYLNGHGYPLGTNSTGGTGGTVITSVQKLQFDVFKRDDLSPLFAEIGT
jgi:hypothetical protein